MSILNDVILDEDLIARGFKSHSVGDEMHWTKIIGVFTILYTPGEGFSTGIDDVVLDHIRDQNIDCYVQLIKLKETKYSTLDEVDVYIDDLIQKTYLCEAIAARFERNQYHIEQEIWKLQEQVSRLTQLSRGVLAAYEDLHRRAEDWEQAGY